MWPFKSNPPLEDLEERVERLEKYVKNLEIEWTNVYDKFRQLHMRVAKRVQRLDQVPEGGDRTPAESAPEQPDALSVRQQTLQRQILMRRNRYPASPGDRRE